MGKKNPELIFLIPSLAGGGAERVASILVPYLAGHFDLTLALLEDRQSFPVSEGVRKVIFSGLLTGQVAHLVRIPQHFLALIRLVRSRKARLVLSFMEQANILNILTSFRTGHKAVIVQHAARRRQNIRIGSWSPLIFFASRRLYRKAAHVIAVSAGIKKILLDDYGLAPERVSVIPNPIDGVAILKQAAENLPIPVSSPFILHVGRLNLFYKAQDVLLSAFRLLRKRHPEISLVLLGDGRDKKRIENLIQSYGLGGSVILGGWQSNVPAFMARAQSLVLCSRYEGWGMVLVEAMACGCPTVATDCPTGPREILGENEYGILVPVDHSERLAQALQDMLEIPALRSHYQEQSARRAQYFTLDRIGAIYVSRLKENLN